MFCPKCGREIEGTPDICPLCNENISEDSKKLREKTMFCPKCGEEIEGTPDICPICQQDISADSKILRDKESFGIGLGTYEIPPRPEKPRKPRKTGILKPIISLVLAVIFLVGSIFGTVLTDINESKASDKTTEAKVVPASGTTVPRYDVDSIVKVPPSDSVFANLVPDNDGATKANEAITIIENSIEAAENNLASAYPEINMDNVYSYISEMSDMAYELYSNGVIKEYRVNEDCIVFELLEGGAYVYAPPVAEYNSGDGSNVPEIYVSTYQPNIGAGQYSSSISSFKTYVDDGASLISSKFDAYTFGDGYNFDDAEVDFSQSSRFGNFNVVLWDGHGCCDSHYGPLMLTGIKRSIENDAMYHSLLKNGIMLYGSESYFIGANFVENYIEDGSLDNTVLYFGTCSSGYTSKLADAFLTKGAEAVYVTSNTIKTSYNAQMTYSICEALSTQKSDGSYYNVEEALEYAKKKNGSNDGGKKNAEVLLYSNNSDFSLNWYEEHLICERDVVLVLDISGSMVDEKLDNTKEAAVEFVNTVLPENARISLVTYDSNADIVNGFTTNQSQLITNINGLSTKGSTNIDEALQTAEALLSKSKANKKIIVLMSDGEPNVGRVGDELIQYANTIKNQDIYIYTLGFFDSYGSKTEAQRIMEGIATEGYHYEVIDAEDLVFFFGDIADNISGQKYIYIEIACPVDVRVRRNGELLSSEEDDIHTYSSFGTLSFEQTDEDDNNVSRQKKILRLKDGMEYDIEINGNGNGTMDYTIQFMDENGNYSDKREFSNIKIKNDTVIETVASSMRDSTVLSVDEDGDGKFESVYEAKANNAGKKVDDTLNTLFKYLAYACGVWLLVSIAFLIMRIYNRKIVAEEKFLSQMQEPVM